MLARITAYLLLVGGLAYEYLEKSPDLPLLVRPSHVVRGWVARIDARWAATPLATVTAQRAGATLLDMWRSPSSVGLVCAEDLWRHNGPISLLSLCKGDRVELEYHSIGCYHNTLHRITLTPLGDGRVAAGVAGPPANPDGAFLRVRVLTRAQVAGLDSWLRIHRRQAGFGGCTSETELIMSSYVAGRLIARETYRDSRCQFDVPAGTIPVQLLAFVPAGEPLPGW